MIRMSRRAVMGSAIALGGLTLPALNRARGGVINDKTARQGSAIGYWLHRILQISYERRESI